MARNCWILNDEALHKELDFKLKKYLSSMMWRKLYKISRHILREFSKSYRETDCKLDYTLGQTSLVLIKLPFIVGLKFSFMQLLLLDYLQTVFSRALNSISRALRQQNTQRWLDFTSTFSVKIHLQSFGWWIQWKIFCSLLPVVTET